MTAATIAIETKGSVLLVIPWSPRFPGGVNTVVRSLHAHLPGAGLHGQIVVSDWERKVPWRDEDGVVHLRFGVLANTRAVSLVRALLVGPATLLRLRRFLRETRATVVNLHYPNLVDLIAMSLLKMGRQWQGQLVVSFHGTDVSAPWTRPERKLWRFGLKRADRITACSRSLAGEVASTFSLPVSRITVAYNGVDHSIFNPDAAHRAVAMPLPDFYVVSVGNYIPRKGHRILLEAFASLAMSHPSLHLVIAGMEGSELTGLRARAEALGLSSRVHCLVDLAPATVAAVVARAAVCVQPSLAEPFGLALIEAAACGVPVVVSGVGGHLEIVDPDLHGHVFPAGDAAACAQALSAVLADCGAATRRAAALRASVRARFDWARSVRIFFSD